MQKKISVLLVLTLIVSSCLTGFTGAWAEAGEKKVTILGTSDLHGRIYSWDYAIDAADADAGLGKIATLVKQERAIDAGAVLIDAGDTVQDNLAELFNSQPVHPMVEALNALNYDTWTLGNHEFNFGLDFLNRNIAGFKGNVLAANIYKDDGSRFVKPYVILNRNGVRIAVVGLITPNIPTWEASMPANFKGLTFSDPVVEAKKAVTELEGKYDVLVGVFHMGDTTEYSATDGALAVAEACPQFNVIFGAHKHGKTDTVVSSNGVKFIEPGPYGWALAKAVVTLGADNKVKSVETKNLETVNVAADSALLEQFKSVHETSQADANKIIGSIKADFIKRPDYITGEAKITTMPTAQLEDNAIIDLINEVQLFYTKADVSAAALFNSASNLKAGDFKKKDVSFIYMYTNTLMGVNITGENLKKYMEWSVGYYNKALPGDVTVSFNEKIRGYNYDMFSGVSYKIDISKDPGSRITNPLINGKPIDNGKVYKLAVNNYRFGTLLDLKLVTAADVYYDSFKIYQDAGRIRDMIISYVQEQMKGVISPKVDNNWEITGFDFNNPLKAAAFSKIKSGELRIPASADGRTLNVRSVTESDLNPVKAPVAPVVPAATETGNGPSDTTYTVKSGDVLWKIAAMYKISWQALAEANHMKNPGMILPGQILVIPAQ